VAAPVAPAPAPVKVPRILSLIAFVGILWYVNQSAPRLVPAVLGLVVLYVALTHVPRVSALLGSAEGSVATAFTPPAAARPPSRQR
jgi:hypothetical protein